MNQDSGEVLTRGRKIDVPPCPRQEVNGKALPENSGNGSFTARNAAFDRRMTELRKHLAKDRAAAQSELSRLSARCDVLKDFLLEADNAADNLEDLVAIIHAEKEFSVRMEQLEIRYYRAYGKFSDNCQQYIAPAASNTESVGSYTVRGGAFKSALPLVLAILGAALIIAFAMALIFV